jgi:hypothetical protein
MEGARREKIGSLMHSVFFLGGGEVRDMDKISFPIVTSLLMGHLLSEVVEGLHCSTVSTHALKVSQQNNNEVNTMLGLNKVEQCGNHVCLLYYLRRVFSPPYENQVEVGLDGLEPRRRAIACHRACYTRLPRQFID